MQIWNIPIARNPFFTGRDALLEQLHTQLQPPWATAISQPQAISGLGGIGKTQLAIEYAYRYRQEYQAILWARADTTEALNAAYTEIAGLLELPQKEAQEQEIIVQAVKNWLQETHDWLLLLDNADDLNIVQPFLPPIYPGHLLLTTRAQTMGKLARRLEIEPLDREGGAVLLLRRAGVIAPDASFNTASASDQSLALALTKELGGLPLALDQAGAYIEETQCDLADYHQQYQTRRAELLAHRGVLVDDHPESVATTWSLSFAKVEAANPTVAELLRACAFLAPDAIPEELLVEVLKTPLVVSDKPERRRKRGGWFSRLTSGSSSKHKLTHLTKSGGEINEAVAILRAYSLIQRNREGKTLQMHRLLQAALRDTLSVEEQRDWMQRTSSAIRAIYPGEGVENWPAFERLLPHILICVTWLEQMELEMHSLVFFLYGCSLYLCARGRYKEAEPLCQQVLAIYEQVLGTNHPDTATCLNNLAALYNAQGKYEEAEPLYQQALAIYEQELGASHPNTATCLNCLAALYHFQEKYVEAELLLWQALVIREQELGANHPSTAISLNNLAEIYQKQGKYEKAEPLYQQALAINEQELGASHPLTAISLNRLAALYYAQGKYEEAEPLYQQALAILEQTLGREHPTTQIVGADYGAFLEAIKQDEDA